MKALDEMNNVEKAYLLAKLFPSDLKDIVQFVQNEIDGFRKREKYIRSVWSGNSLITADFWFGLVQNTQEILESHNVMLYRSGKVFSDHLFDGLNAILLTHILIEFAEKKSSKSEIVLAIHLLFGHEK